MWCSSDAEVTKKAGDTSPKRNRTWCGSHGRIETCVLILLENETSFFLFSHNFQHVSRREATAFTRNAQIGTAISSSRLGRREPAITFVIAARNGNCRPGGLDKRFSRVPEDLPRSGRFSSRPTGLEMSGRSKVLMEE